MNYSSVIFSSNLQGCLFSRDIKFLTNETAGPMLYPISVIASEFTEIEIKLEMPFI